MHGVMLAMLHRYARITRGRTNKARGYATYGNQTFHSYSYSWVHCEYKLTQSTGDVKGLR